MLISLGINLLVLGIIGSITIRVGSTIKEKVIENAFGLLTEEKPVEISRSGGSESTFAAVSQQATQNISAQAAVISPNENVLPLIVSSKPKQLSFDVVSMASVPSVLNHPTAITTGKGNNAAGAGHGSGSKDGEGVGIDGMKIQAKNLGVICDVSGSMRHYLPALELEIMGKFPNAVYVSAGSCSLYNRDLADLPEDNDAAIAARKNTTCARRYFTLGYNKNITNTLGGLIDILALEKVDAIFWFSDFRDLKEPEAVKRFAAIIHQYGIRLYIQSVDDFPVNAALMKIVHESGGEYGVLWKN